MVQAHPDVMSAPHHPGFFQRKSVQTVLPFLTSFAFHAGLVAVAASLYQAVKTMTTVSEVQTVMNTIDVPTRPDSININGFVGVGKNAHVAPGQPHELLDIDPASTKFQPGNSSLANLDPGGRDGDNAANELIGIGIGRPRGNGRGNGDGGGIGDGFGEAPQGKMGRIGVDPRGGEPLFSRNHERKVVYVCDATGSMTPAFAGLRHELGKAISHLGDGKLSFFNVIFFSDDKVLSLSPQLMPSNAAGKGKAMAFIEDTTPRGLTNPLPAIRAAFAQDPEVIHVLTDGFDQVQDLSTVVKEFDVLNKDRKVRVNTILIGTVEQKELVDALRTIAEKNGGTMKIVSKEDF